VRLRRARLRERFLVLDRSLAVRTRSHGPRTIPRDRKVKPISSSPTFGYLGVIRVPIRRSSFTLDVISLPAVSAAVRRHPLELSGGFSYAV